MPEMLHSEDALSMAFSLESRLPFLDHRIVEFCFSLAYDHKIGAGWTKLLLRQATAGILPEPVRWRRHKLGFPGDYESWLGSASGLDAVRALLLDRVTQERGWLDPAWLRRRLGGERSRAAHWVSTHVQRVWELVALELWCRQFLDGDDGLRLPPPARTRQAAGYAPLAAPLREAPGGRDSFQRINAMPWTGCAAAAVSAPRHCCTAVP